MLLKNGKKFELTPAQINKLNELFPTLKKGGVIIKYPKSAYKKNAKNDRPDSAAGKHIPMTAIKSENGIPVEYTYYESAVPGKNGGPTTYTPPIWTLSGTKLVDNIELAWFLYYCSPYGYKTEAASGSAHNFFEFENKVTEAREYIQKTQVINRAKVYILDDEIGLSDDKVRTLAKSYNLNVKDLDIAEVRQALDTHLTALYNMKRKNPQVYQDFLDNCDMGEGVKMKAEIQDAIDNEIIKYDARNGKKSFFYTDNEGKITKTAVVDQKFTPAQAAEGLFKAFDNNKELYQTFLNTVKSRRDQLEEVA